MASHLFSMRSSAIKRRQSCLGDLLLNGLSPVLHEIERDKETSKLPGGPPIKWPHLFSMRSSALKTSKLLGDLL